MAFGIGDLLALPNVSQLLDAFKQGLQMPANADVLRSWFPGFSDRTINLGIDYYRRGSQAAQSLIGLQPDESLYRADIPVNPTIGAAYQYTMTIGFDRPIAGHGIMETVVCEQATNIGKGDVEQCGRDFLARMLRMEGRDSDFIRLTMNAVAYVNLETVFRRS